MTKRWQLTTRELKKRGLNVVAYSSDGDTRYFGAMKRNLKFGQMNMFFNHWCPIDMTGNEVFFQDDAHRCNNCKNRFCDTAISMKMGNFPVTVNHLIVLYNLLPKNVHGLNSSDIHNDDPMNYTVIYKIASDKILKLLENYVINSEATIEYLKMLRMLLDAFMNEELAVTQRIYNSFYVMFAFRYWRSWCMESREDNLSNFITLEGFLAIEMNCWNLLKLVRLCRDVYSDEIFLIFLMNSQICEKFFRQLRSMTSTYSTVINFSALEILEKIQKIQIQEEIMHELKDEFEFRKNLHNNLKHPQISSEKMPSDIELQVAIDKAFNDASIFATKLGIWLEEDVQVKRKNFFPPQDEEEKHKKISVKSEELRDTTDHQQPEIFEFQGMKFLNSESGLLFPILFNFVIKYLFSNYRRTMRANYR